MQPISQNRALPAYPSLEHLRKEAKQQLVQLRSRAGSTQLADAQLLVARTYGYSSWRALKDEVDRRCESLGLLPPTILRDFVPRPQRAHQGLVRSSVDAEQALFRVVAIPFLAAPAAQAVGLIIAFLLG